MERLTEVTIEDGVKLYDISEKLCLSRTTQGEKITTILKKLADYEDLEEQGMLIKLPCKVGDILWTNHRMQGWYFRSKDAPYRVQVAFIGLNDSEEMGGGLFNVCYENHGYMMQFNFSDIGKTVFLIREEAEEALKIAGGENVLV